MTDDEPEDEPEDAAMATLTVDGRSFMKFQDGWLDLGPASAVDALDDATKLALAKALLDAGISWHRVPERLM